MTEVNFLVKKGLTVPKGSASTPSVIFDASDPNTGLYSPGADQVAVATNGTGRLFIDASGNVGVGTASPGTALHLGNSSTLRINNPDGTRTLDLFNDANNAEIKSTVDPIRINAFHSTGYVRFDTNNQERARIDSSGRLLVGTSTARSNFFNTASSAPQQLQVEGTTGNTCSLSSICSAADTSGGRLLLAHQRSGAVGGNTILNSGDQAGYITFQGNDGGQFVECASIDAQVDGTPGADDMPGRLVFSTTADGASSATEQMRIDNAGNLKFNSGYGSAATAYGCRAWVNFNGTGTPAIRASGNVSSITDISAGYYEVNFTTAMPDANYAAIVTTDTYGISILGTVSTSGCQVQIGYVSNTSGGVTLGDVGTICCSFFR
jgi:hypothetical protein